MADQNELSLSITTRSNVRPGLQNAENEVRSAGSRMRSSLRLIEGGGNAAGGATASLEHRVRALKGEMASGDRTINFFARSLNALVPEASAAGQGIRLLADGLVGGLGVGLALQAVMAGFELFGEHLRKRREELEKASEATAKQTEEAKKLNAEIRTNNLIAGGVSPTAAKQSVQRATFEEEIKNQQDLATYWTKLAAAKRQELQNAGGTSLSDLFASGKAQDALKELEKKAKDSSDAMRKLQVDYAAFQRQSASENLVARMEEGRKAETAFFELRKDTLTKEDQIFLEAEIKRKRVGLEFAQALPEEKAKMERAIMDRAFRDIKKDREDLDFQYYSEALKRADDFASKLREKMTIQPSFTGGYEWNPEKGTYVEKTPVTGDYLKPALGPTQGAQVDFAGNRYMGGIIPGAGDRAQQSADQLHAIDKDREQRAADEARKLDQLYGEPIRQGFRSIFASMLDTTLSAGQSMKKAFADIFKQLTMNFATGWMGMIPGIGKAFGGARADGGPVSFGSAYLVGERGPEVFVPRASGTIVPNGGGAAPTNVTIVAHDPRSFEQYVRDNPNAILRVLDEARRNRRIA